MCIRDRPYTVFTGDGWDGSDDLAPTWWVAWDDVYLYFAFSVADDIHAQNQSCLLYTSRCV